MALDMYDKKYSYLGYPENQSSAIATIQTDTSASVFPKWIYPRAQIYIYIL